MLTEQEIARLSPDERRALSDYLSGGKNPNDTGPNCLATLPTHQTTQVDRVLSMPSGLPIGFAELSKPNRGGPIFQIDDGRRPRIHPDILKIQLGRLRYRAAIKNERLAVVERVSLK